MSLDRGFRTSCLLHCGHLTVSANSVLLLLLLLLLVVYDYVQMYPHLDVWNVVEASEKVTIANWCNFAHNNCHHRFKVRPFRCLGTDTNIQTSKLMISMRHGNKLCPSVEIQKHELWPLTGIRLCSRSYSAIC